MPEILHRIVDIIRKHKRFRPRSGGSDPRIDSAEGEQSVINLLHSENVPIKAANIAGLNRAAYDILVADKYYVDIKISELTNAADNTNAKAALYYTLTGQSINKIPSQHKYYFPSLKEGIASFSRDKQREDDIFDYYYLIIGKHEQPDSPMRCFITSLRSLKEVATSANNLPFQCVWRKNIQAHPRNYDEAKDFLLGEYAKSMHKLMETAGLMKTVFPQYFP